MKPIIKIENLSRTFKTKDRDVNALVNINLDIEKGDIYGIIGLSGAGKSTLIRCLNLLERPDKGSVYINGVDLLSLSVKELNLQRSKMSMIFQHFNLLMQKSVLDNVCFPLLLAGCNKAEAKKKAEEYLSIVGILDKANAYPAQLSGGQKQRVAIARALASSPEILLCDEATSALDPQTTKAILNLLKDINEKYGITIVIITHEMNVVEEICSHCAILSNGELAETGSVSSIFSSPKSEIGKKLIYGKKIEIPFEGISRMIRIVFTENSSFEPVIANMVLKFKVPVNIMRADTRNIDGIAKGQMVLQLPEDEALIVKIKDYLVLHGLEVEDYVNINEEGDK